MKKKIVIVSFFIAYVLILGFGLACLWHLIGFFITACAFGTSVIKEHPLFFPFCVLAGIAALFALIGSFYAHLKASKKLSLSKGTVWIPIVLSVPVSLPTVHIWMDIFELLRRMV